MSSLGCGGAYQLTEGHAKTIKSEGYDQSRNYPANSNCRWLFLGSRTEFEVSILIMDLEVCGSCSCDYIKIEPFASKTPTYKLCSKPRNDYLIKGDMAVLFHSDGSNEDEGFVVNITAWEGKKGAAEASDLHAIYFSELIIGIEITVQLGSKSFYRNAIFLV